jgi:hypothetical protein
MSEASPPRIRCRAIAIADSPAVIALLTRGFPERTIDYWTHALRALAERDSLEGFPQFGYMIENDSTPVGVILMIFRHAEGDAIRCNISSWYVDDAFRGFASLLIAAALRHKNVTYVNISPTPHTWPVIEAQGFRRYSSGQMLTFPALSFSAPSAAIESFDPSIHDDSLLASDEYKIMIDHVGRGCIGLVTRDGQAAQPFLFLPRHVLGNRIPVLQLVYCRDIFEFVRLAKPIGRWLLHRGHLMVLVDALERFPGMPGVFFKDRGPKYARGPSPPRLGDLSFCENVLFGP